MKAIALRAFRPRWGVGPQVIVVLLVIGLFGALLIEPTRQLLEQRERIAGMASHLEKIDRSNERLEDRIARLNDPDFLEQRARTQVGLVRPGETTYIVMPPSRGAGKPGKRADRKAPVTRPEPPGLIEGFLDFIGVP
jgi:cell division protein FtsB